jgi:FixJ family two-component response regulator
LHLGRLQETSCLVVDVHMPGMNGLQLQSHLAAAGHRIPIVFITAYADERIRTLALRGWGNGLSLQTIQRRSLTQCN